MESSSSQEDSTFTGCTGRPRAKTSSGYIGRPWAKFLPVNSDDSLIFSTRGQNLQSVMMAQSQQRHFSMSSQRRLSVNRESRDEERGLGSPARNLSAEREGRHMKERRMSSGAKTLMTPEMRSMRLIGNSNPRYHWSARRVLAFAQ